LKRCGKKFKIFHHVNCKILAFKLTNILLGACKKMGNCTPQGYICMKKYPKWWLHFGFILQGKLAMCLEKFRSFGIVQHIKKK